MPGKKNSKYGSMMKKSKGGMMMKKSKGGSLMKKSKGGAMMKMSKKKDFDTSQDAQDALDHAVGKTRAKFGYTIISD